jgi:hypothetical protein
LVVALALGLLAGCGSEAKPTTGEKPPPASEVFDKTDKDMKAPKGKIKTSGADPG